MSPRATRLLGVAVISIGSLFNNGCLGTGRSLDSGALADPMCGVEFRQRAVRLDFSNVLIYGNHEPKDVEAISYIVGRIINIRGNVTRIRFLTEDADLCARVTIGSELLFFTKRDGQWRITGRGDLSAESTASERKT